MGAQIKKSTAKKEKEGGTAVNANPKVLEKGKQTIEEIDKLMDEIDDVLEENAEQFVKNYVQKGGE